MALCPLGEMFSILVPSGTEEGCPRDSSSVCDSGHTQMKIFTGLCLECLSKACVLKACLSTVALLGDSRTFEKMGASGKK